METSFLMESVFEESALNNISFNNYDLSKVQAEEPTLQNCTTNDHISPNLIRTQKPNEKEILDKYCSDEDASLIDINQATNSWLQTSSKTIIKDASTHSSKDTCKAKNKEASIDVGEEKDESVIPVEEDEDEDNEEEISVNDSLTVETQQEDMFSHLQPNMIATVEEMNEDREVMINVQQELSQRLQDESKLFHNPFIEVGRRLWPSTVERQLYTKGCMWSPDGTCLLVPVHLDGMHIIELPVDLYDLQEMNTVRNLSELASAVHVKEGGTVYDYCWYPYMNSSDAATCCWLATRQHEPIHMWDAFNGELRCSYRGYDDVDEVESAISIIFSNDGQKVIGGYKKTIKIFDTNIPGRNCSSISVKKAVSCFALTTDSDNCVTAGTWSGYINHYDLRVPKLGSLFTLGGHCGGITWMKYVPTHDQNWYLFSGARKDNKILQWDMRNYREPVKAFERNVKTNQRIYYDLTPLSNWLGSGDTDGLLRIWNLTDKEQQFELPLHQDCCNGVSFHPTLPVISTSSGQYHFVDVTESETDDKQEKIVNYENSLVLMWYGPSKV